MSARPSTARPAVVGLIALLSLAVGGACDRAAAERRAEVAPAPASAPTDPWTDAWILAQAPAYLDDPAARRDALEHSLRNATNIYSRMRLAAYGQRTSGWDVLPEWNPRSRALDAQDVGDLQAGRPVRPVAGGARLWDGQRPTTMAAWVELGRAVFFTYPLRPEPAAAHALATNTAAALGVQRDGEGQVPGLVAYADVDGRDRVGITCALCHSAVQDGRLVVGRARRDLDYGAMRLAHDGSLGVVDPQLDARMSSWGPGRADITEDDDQDPVAIPDLWRVRELRDLTQAATIVHKSPLALAIRQETQLLHANGERVRPPRELAWALAMYVYSLQPPVARLASDVESDVEVETLARRGQDLFVTHCASCHGDANGSGKAVTARRAGTDPALANGHARGTGVYRPAPLVALADAGPYLHTGDVASLEDLLDPTRMQPRFDRGVHGPGPIAGHEFGTDLPAPDRTALVAWLRTL